MSDPAPNPIPASANERLDALLTRIEAPSNGWKAMRAEWMKPAGVIPLITLIGACAIGGLALRETVRDGAARNDVQTAALNKQGSVLEPLPRLIERLTDRIEASERRQQEELLAWREWRKGVDAQLQASRDTSIEAAQNRTRSEGLDTRISRVVELFQAQGKETNAKLERILIEQAEVKARLEARAREPGSPFPQGNRTWSGFPPRLLLEAIFRPGLGAGLIRRGGE